MNARIMDHGIPCLAYVVREEPRLNIDMAALAESGLSPGRWMQQLKDPTLGDDASIEVGEATYRLGELRRRLLVRTPGPSVGYLTDFGLDDRAERDLEAMIRGCDAIVGEASYLEADAELARQNRHLTGPEMGRIAARAGARKLVLFHLSDRYTRDQWRELLNEVRQVFPAASFSAHWCLE